MKIVAIGGASVKDSLHIDKEIVALSKKKAPKFLFIPTASSDSELYWNVIGKRYKRLGCRIDVLFLLKESPTKKEMREKILGADIIYVGGGNTLKMMRRWRFLGVDKLLKKAGKNGAVLCGSSAGAICWFEYGHSDSMSYYNEKKWQYICVKGLGFLKGVHCPHYDSETLGVKRKNSFKNMMKKRSDVGIAIDECCAVFYNGKKRRVIRAKKGVNAYEVTKEKGKIVESIIDG
ncbi:MAG: peptidase E [Candidatus Woesearchaeota archaeon]|nr:peptidase E [Candidatus Woesearchaeota archaeon]